MVQGLAFHLLAHLPGALKVNFPAGITVENDFDIYYYEKLAQFIGAVMRRCVYAALWYCPSCYFFSLQLILLAFISFCVIKIVTSQGISTLRINYNQGVEPD
ncbi:unnamed protein product [Clavelina lepadiformis]|uniref:Uncharacterized protein n=1 Tax=Clavelina lepadiformis TaxID=159417 RepID=A0ABP0GZ74_CLALP